MSESEPGREGPPITQGELRPVFDAVRQYGQTHPGVLEQIWYEASPQRVVALLGGADVAIHETGLRALVSVPGHLEVKRSLWPQGHLEHIREEIMQSTRASISGVGLGKGVLVVRLWADQLDVAASLHQRFGGAVVLTVGYLPYPDIESSKTADFGFNREQADLAALPDEVSLSLDDDIEIRSGSHVHSELTIRNDSTLDLVAGKLVPSIADLTSGHVVGGYEGAISMEMRRYEVPAGASKDVPILIGTASTRSDLGYAVPPGLWAIRALLQLGGRRFQRMVPIEVLPQ
jgi:hypothetical protein